MTTPTVDVGTKIYYTGDMANASGHFEVVARVNGASPWVTLVELGGEGRSFKGIHVHNIGHEYHGHCNPRFVTEAARQAFYQSKR